VVCGTDEFVEALRRLLEKRPDLRPILERTINCSGLGEVLGDTEALDLEL
jgi:hypothetical protein